MWHVTCDMWHMKCDKWQMTYDMRHVTCDMRHVTCDMLWGWTFSRNVSSLALTVCDLWYYEDFVETAPHLMNDKVVYRTAPATPGLLKSTRHWGKKDVRERVKEGTGEKVRGIMGRRELGRKRRGKGGSKRGWEAHIRPSIDWGRKGRMRRMRRGRGHTHSLNILKLVSVFFFESR